MLHSVKARAVDALVRNVLGNRQSRDFVWSGFHDGVCVKTQPVSVRKYSHELAQAKHKEHEEAGGNKSSEVPDPDDEDAIQVPPPSRARRNCLLPTSCLPEIMAYRELHQDAHTTLPCTDLSLRLVYIA